MRESGKVAKSLFLPGNPLALESDDNLGRLGNAVW
jgi:hypothetical protein